MGKVIGIDLGTGFSAVSIMDNGKPKIIENAEGARTTPSVIAFTDKDELVGITAKNQMVVNPDGTFYEVKRLIGRSYNDKEVKEMTSKVGYKITKSTKNNDAWLEYNDKKMAPAEISAKILAKLKKDAESYLGETVTDAVVTVPAYFNDSQRQATKDAAEIAGLNVLRIVNEPTAAALSYGLDKKEDGIFVVFDLGSGTFDCSILELSDGVFDVKATNGDTFLGGSMMDEILQEYLIDEFKKDKGIDLSTDKLAVQRLKETAEKVKIELSSKTETEANVPYITATSSGPQHLNIKVSRAKYESLISDLLERTVAPCKQMMKDANVELKDITEVLLIGGATRTPLVQQKVKEIFGKEPSKDVNPDEAVSLGAAIQAGILKGDVTDVLLLDVTPLNLSIETLGGVATTLVESNTTIPTRKSQVFSTASDNQPAVSIRVCQGQRPMFNDNKLLGNFDLTDIPPAPRGVPQIEVSFDIDANGILKVSAKDIGTGKEQAITITSDGGLSKDDIERMKTEAEMNAEVDKKKSELIVAKNDVEQFIFGAEKQLSEHKDKLSSDLVTEVESIINEAKENIKKDDITIDELTSMRDKGQEVLMKIGTEIYSKTQSETTVESDDNVKDTEFVDAEEVEVTKE